MCGQIGNSVCVLLSAMPLYRFARFACPNRTAAFVLACERVCAGRFWSRDVVCVFECLYVRLCSRLYRTTFPETTISIVIGIIVVGRHHHHHPLEARIGKLTRTHGEQQRPHKKNTTTNTHRAPEIDASQRSVYVECEELHVRVSISNIPYSSFVRV